MTENLEAADRLAVKAAASSRRFQAKGRTPLQAPVLDWAGSCFAPNGEWPMQAVPIELDLVKPVGAGGNLGSGRG